MPRWLGGKIGAMSDTAPQMSIALRILKWIFWGALWAIGLVGMAAIGLIIYFIIDHIQNCRPPSMLNRLSIPDCYDIEDSVVILFRTGAPLVIPLLIALIIRFVSRRLRP